MSNRVRQERQPPAPCGRIGGQITGSRLVSKPLRHGGARGIAGARVRDGDKKYQGFTPCGEPGDFLLRLRGRGTAHMAVECSLNRLTRGVQEHVTPRRVAHA